MFARISSWRRWWWRWTGRSGLVVLVDLVDVVPRSLAARADLVVTPVDWHRRAALVRSLARDGHTVVCLVEGGFDAEVHAAVRDARRGGRRVAVRTVGEGIRGHTL